MGIHDGDDAWQRRCAELLEQFADVRRDAVDVEIDVDLTEMRCGDVSIQILRAANALRVDPGAAAPRIKEEVALALRQRIADRNRLRQRRHRIRTMHDRRIAHAYEATPESAQASTVSIEVSQIDHARDDPPA